MKQPLETTVLTKLREAAASLAGGGLGPRWIFLVGGPGNGKSEAVEAYCEALDSELGLSGKLTDLLIDRFAAIDEAARVVTLTPSDVDSCGGEAAARIRSLVLIQDASASERPDQDAAEQLVNELAEILGSAQGGDGEILVLLCCANRGLLSRALNCARRDEKGDVAALLAAVATASSLGVEALQNSRPSCWPMDIPEIEHTHPSLRNRVACWPVDVESLQVSLGGGADSAASSMLDAASDVSAWDMAVCADCDSRAICPFRQNATWLRDPERQKGLLRILRHGELATGQRWSFRDSYSLVAQLMVGEAQDFDRPDAAGHPCDWVHDQATALAGLDIGERSVAALKVVGHLYPYQLFGPPSVASTPAIDAAIRTHAVPTSAALMAGAGGEAPETTYIRRVLRQSIRPLLDTAMWSPTEPAHPLTRLEDDYAQSVGQGNQAWAHDPAPAERALLEMLDAAEHEWDPMARESQAAGQAVALLRIAACMMAKRSVGVRAGWHDHDELLADYEATLRDTSKLSETRKSLRRLLGDDSFTFNALSSFAQAEATGGGLVMLIGDRVEMAPARPAPDGSRSLPAHDLPVIEVAGHQVPVTFDLFTALQLVESGCARSSLGGSARALLDRLTQLYAGRAARKTDDFLRGDARFQIGEYGAAVVLPGNESPSFRSGNG